MEHQLIQLDGPMQPHANEQTRTDCEVELTDMAHNAMVPVCNRLGVAHAMFARHLRALADDLTRLHALGANEVELRSVEDVISTHIDGLTSGEHASDLHVVARMELDADIAEDAIEGLIAIEGVSPVLLEKHVAALRKQSTTSRVRARVVARIARQLRQNRTVAANRLGVSA